MTNKFYAVLIALFGLMPNMLWGQINIGGLPPSFTHLGRLKGKVPVYQTPPLNMAAIVAEDEADETNGLPPRFGYPHEVSLDLQNAGVWEELPNGDRIWRLSLHCPDAQSINLLYDAFWLPPGAVFYIYDSGKEKVIGGFTEANNKGPQYDPAAFATGLVFSSGVTLEYFEPLNVQGQGVISVSNIVHGYKNLLDFSDSGTCNVNVNCSPEGDDWQDEKTGVAMILVNGSRACTGSLIKNTAGDGTPYFLTANHCLGGLDAVTNPDANNWMFWWNYESAGCANGVDFMAQETAGATLRANHVDSDFALFELAEHPYSLTPSVQAFFNGWNRTGTIGTTAIGIHHPSGDIKKISEASPVNATTIVGVPGGIAANYWEPHWVGTTNGDGVTEPGSSGSPLFDDNSRIIGQLFGGPSFCAGPDLWDAYGKISASWNIGAASTGRLRDWLDPLGTAPNTLDGMYWDGCRGDDANFVTPVGGATATKFVYRNTITSSGGIVPGSVVEFIAGDFVCLNPGFTADASTGSRFLAMIGPCTDGFSNSTLLPAPPAAAVGQPFGLFNAGLAPPTLTVFPNPAGGEFTVAFQLESPSTVTIRLLDGTGRLAATVHPKSNLEEGSHWASFDAGLVPEGFYFVILETNKSVLKEKLVISR